MYKIGYFHAEPVFQAFLGLCRSRGPSCLFSRLFTRPSVSCDSVRQFVRPFVSPHDFIDTVYKLYMCLYTFSFKEKKICV